MFRQFLSSLAVAFFCCVAIAQGSTAPSATDSAAVAAGPVRLRQPVLQSTTGGEESQYGERHGHQAQDADGSRALSAEARDRVFLPAHEAQPGEFVLFVRHASGNPSLQRFGDQMLIESRGSEGTSFTVPPDYIISPGDEIVLTLWGSIDADLRLIVDRSGQVSIPRVGPVMLAGVRYAEAPKLVRRRVGEVFRNFDLSLSLGRLRGIRVYVTGFVERPGAYTVSSLSTVMQAILRAGGPSSSGSFRNVELRRASQPAVTYDLYDLLLKGDRGAERVLQSGDVLHVSAVGRQVAVIGSVNNPGVFELTPSETLSDALRMAGGFNAVADRSRVAVERLRDRDTVRVAEIRMPAGNEMGLNSGDIVQVFSAVDVALPVQRQSKRVRIEGEVVRPGLFILPAGSKLSDALAAAGGVTPSAFVFGTEFQRESVRLRQQENYDRALRDLEVDFTKMTTTQRASSSDDAAVQTARAGNASRLIERLRAVKPNGRIVLQVSPENASLPDLEVEEGDRIYIPPRPTSVGVFGSVFNGGSYLYSDGQTLEAYLRMAGGPTKGADSSSTFVIRANGSVVSNRQTGGWFSLSNLGDIPAVPGDTIFVPEEFNKTTFIQSAKDWTQILSQFGIGVAAIKSLSK